MPEVRVNGRRMPNLQPVSVMGSLLEKLETWGQRTSTVLTRLSINGSDVEFESAEMQKMRLGTDDLIEVKMESPEQMSYESLQVAQDMAELLIFDLKVATIQMWEAAKAHQSSMETLLDDCQLFLLLAARPIDLLGVKLDELPYDAERCLRELDSIAQYVEDATLLCVHEELRDACAILCNRVLPCIEKWMGASGHFAEFLNIDRVPIQPGDGTGVVSSQIAK